MRTKHNRHNDDEELCESRRPAAPPRCNLTPTRRGIEGTRHANWNRGHAAAQGRLHMHTWSRTIATTKYVESTSSAGTTRVRYDTHSPCQLPLGIEVQCAVYHIWYHSVSFRFLWTLLIMYTIVVVVMCYIFCVHVLRYCYDNLFHALGEGHKWTPGA